MPQLAITIEHVMHVSVNGLSTHIPVRHDDDEGDDQQSKRAVYFRLAKSDHKLTRLLTCAIPRDVDSSVDKKHLISRTDIIETITMLRDKKFMEEVHGDANYKGQVRYTNKRIHSKIMALPSRMVVTVPPTCGLGEKELNVLTSKPGSPLWVEFNHDILQYMCTVVTNQVKHGTVSPRKHKRSEVADEDRVDTVEAGVSFSYARNEFRVTYKDGCGTKRCRVFPVKENGIEEAREKAVSAARTAGAS